MANSEREGARLVSGILEAASGSTAPIQIVRKGVIKGLRGAIKVKRPNQYKY